MKKKWTYIIGIIVIVVPVLFLFVSFNGNPLSKWQAKKIAVRYLDDVYEDRNYYWIHETNFNFKDNTYFIRYAHSDLYEATVEVGNGLWPTKVVHTYANGDYHDIDADHRISEGAKRELKTLLEENFPVKEVNYHVSIPNTVGITSVNYEIRQKTPYKPTIYITLETETLTQQQAQELAMKIRSKMNEEQIYYVDFNVNMETKGDKQNTTYYYHVTKNAVKLLEK